MLTERSSLRLIWGDLALPELACSFQMAIGPTKMILAFCSVVAVCTLGFVMDTCKHSVINGYANGQSGMLQSELTVYINDTPKETKEFIDINRNQNNRKGVFSTLWTFVSGRFHDATTQLLNLSNANPYSNVRYALYNVWLCIRAVGWAFRFHPVYSLIYFAVSFVVYVFIGGAISRCAALEFAKAEKPGLFESVLYAAENFRAFMSAPLLPLGLVGLFALMVILLGVITAIPRVGEFLMTALFGIVLLFGFLVTLLTIGSIAGGLLLFPSIAYEKTTGMDSIGRAFSYVLSRPIWMVYYVLLSGVLGTFFYLILRLLIFLALRLTYTLLLAGLTIAHAESKLEHIWPEPGILNFLSTVPRTEVWTESVAAFVIRLFMLGIVALLLSFIVSYFFSAATVIYAMMRKKVDKIGIDRVYMHLEQVSNN